VCEFEDLEYANIQNVLFVLRCVLTCLNDEELPVKVQAALALYPLIRHQEGTLDDIAMCGLLSCIGSMPPSFAITF